MEAINLKNKVEVSSKGFMDLFPTIVEDIISGIKIDSPELKTHVEALLQYTVPNGKKIRGLMVPEAYNMLEQKEKLTSENIKLSYIVGWLMEIAEAAILMFDDIMDKSEIRRGTPCWHTKENVGLNAIKDGLILQQACYLLLRKYLSQHPQILSIYQHLHSGSWKTTGGQAFDCMFTKDGKCDLTLFTSQAYKNLVKYKTAHYSFVAPVAGAMCLANIVDTTIHKDTYSVLLDLGEIFQIQDDFLDCFGDRSKENVGGDIYEGKCTWLVVKALEKANLEQKKLLEEYYGSGDPNAVEIIRKLYQDLDLPGMYAEFEEKSFEKIQSRIQQLIHFPGGIFSTIIGKLYKRNV